MFILSGIGAHNAIVAPNTCLQLQINRLAGMAVMLHCLIPTAWVPPLSPPTASPILGTAHLHGIPAITMQLPVVSEGL